MNERVAGMTGITRSLKTEFAKERDMKVVFEGKKIDGAREMSGCGCACHPSIGAIGNNKPATQVKW